jgi:hypothetical protein
LIAELLDYPGKWLTNCQPYPDAAGVYVLGALDPDLYEIIDIFTIPEPIGPFPFGYNVPPDHLP